jgi:hypothetical protein
LKNDCEDGKKLYARKKSEWFCTEDRLKKQIEIKDVEIDALIIKFKELKNEFDSNMLTVSVIYIIAD